MEGDLHGLGAAAVHRARDALLAFFDAHRRDLPWRRTHDPYAIWVSEIMLQQTRVETAIPYYERFLARFPTARALADSPEDAVLSAWAGLGYYRRARMLHAGARAVVERHGGAVPSDVTALRALPGIGEYTAGAIASIAFGRAEPVVDGNVERVVTRFLAIRGDPRTASNKRTLWAIARSFASGARPGDTNQALMELGATVCVPVAPKCRACPLRSNCAARRLGAQEELPEKRERAPIRTERWSALVGLSRNKQSVWLTPSEIGRWEGMLLPPILRARNPSTLFAQLGAGNIVQVGMVKHVLTHAAMQIKVYRGSMARRPTRGEWVAISEISRKPIPKVTRVVLACAGVEIDSGTFAGRDRD